MVSMLGSCTDAHTIKFHLNKISLVLAIVNMLQIVVVVVVVVVVVAVIAAVIIFIHFRNNFLFKYRVCFTLKFFRYNFKILHCRHVRNC
jgi:hypothetical protein